MILKIILLLVDLGGKSCLDVGCHDGFWSFRLGHFGINRLTGIDWNEKMIFRANFLKTVYNFPSFVFRNQEIFEFLTCEKETSYDIVLLLSILYHLPEQIDWQKFFYKISAMNNEFMIIDTRWFDDENYYYDRSTFQAVIRTDKGKMNKWRPKRKDIFSFLFHVGYKQLIEVNPSGYIF